MELVRATLKDLQGHSKTVQSIQEHMFAKFPQVRPINKTALKQILKQDLHYYFGKPELRTEQSNRADVVLNRHVYACFFRALVKNKARFIWIDESSFNSRSLKYNSWIGPGDTMIKMHQVESPSTTISALTDDGIVYSQLSFGSNDDTDILHFLIELKKTLKAQHKDEYRMFLSKLVLVMDNASVHKTELVSKFFEKSGIVAVTLPQYSPQMNPIERFFRAVKRKVANANLFH